MKTIGNQESRSIRSVTFINDTPLTRSEVCYALETLLDWRGVKFTSNDDGTLTATY